MATLYVSQTAGLDTNPGTQAQPFQTIGKGAAVGVNGDTVLVEGGTYPEEVLPPRTGVSFVAAAGARPVLEGGGTRNNGFYVNSTAISGIRVEGFEIRNYIGTGIYLGFQKGVNSNHTVHNNYIHHIGAKDSATNVFGVYLVYGNPVATANEISQIGTMAANESSGIRLLYCHNARVDGNDIHTVRKECVRDYNGLRTQITNNKVTESWTGLALNQSLSALVANNYVSRCVAGFNPKHTNEDGIKTYWGYAIDDPTLEFCRFYHNTVWRSADNHLYLAVNLNPTGSTIPGYMRDLDVRDNIFTGLAGSHIWDNPAARAGTTIIDYNVYGPLAPLAFPPTQMADGPVYFWRKGYSFGSAGTTMTMAETQTTYGWNANSRIIDPQLNNPNGGDLDYGAGSPANTGGINLGTQWGAQIGARGLGTSATTHTQRHPATVISSKSPERLYNERVRAADEMQFVYFQAASTLDEWLIVDFGASQTFNTVVYDPWTHGSANNIKGYRIETSSDGTTFTNVFEGTNSDSGGASLRYLLNSDATARYVRFTAVSSWGSNTIFGDLRFYYQVRTAGTAPPPPPTDTTAPTVALTAPAAGASLSGDITVTATASDNIGVTKVELSAGGVLIATDTSAPYSAVWTTTSNDAGTKVITAKAYDAAGNTTTDSRTITVTTAPPPPPVTTGPYWGIQMA